MLPAFCLATLAQGNGAQAENSHCDVFRRDRLFDGGYFTARCPSRSPYPYVSDDFCGGHQYQRAQSRF
jgi:hypothetical protein